jgi:predicted O-linked N-acetylglucosamine transferase (SPINDLY family)
VLAQYPQNKQAAQGLASLGLSGSLAPMRGMQPSQEQLERLIGLFNADQLQMALEQGQALADQCLDDPLLQNLLGAVHTRMGQPEQAIVNFTLAIEFKPDYAEAFSNLGAACNDVGDYPKAIESYTRAIQLEPGNADAHYNLGNTLRDTGRLQEAITSYTAANKRGGGHARALNNLGIVLNKLGRTEEAISSYRKAIQLGPDFPEAHANLGTQLYVLGYYEESVASHRRAIALQPEYAAAHIGLGTTLLKLGRVEEALGSHSKAVQLDPKDAEAHKCLGHSLSEAGRSKEAIASYAAALQCADTDEARAQMYYQQAQICDWEAIRADTDAISHLGLLPANTDLNADSDLLGNEINPFSLLAMEDNPAHHHQRSVLYARNTYRNPTLPAVKRPQIKPERLRIGYFSADFHNHATMFLMARLFELHDASQFIVHAYSYGVSAEDGMRQRLKEAVDVFHDVGQLNDQAVAELARSEQIDVAIDLKGYTNQGRSSIFSYRAAPVQISYLGYPGTLGAPFMDYIIADDTVIPADQSAHYSEQVIRLPHSYQVNDSSREISDKVITRTDAGLPETGFVFCCFNNNYKIGPREFDVWMRLLQQVDGSVLWLFEANPLAAENLRSEAQKRGVAPERIILAEKLPLPEHLARHALADLFLDTFNYNAHTTASDALWAGLPLVTLLGEGFAARVGGSLLNAVGLPELVTHSVQAYEQLALELALNPSRLAKIRAKLANNRLSAPLFDSELFTRHIEQAYQQAYQRYFDGEDAAAITVQASSSV